MPADEAEVAGHGAAIEQAYLLIEAAQGHHDAARVEAADREATGQGWGDVRLLLHFARSLACLEEGGDDTAHVEAMLDTAVSLGDNALLALAIAVKAARRATRRRTTTAGESAGALLVQAVVLLDDDDPATPVVHRACALIEVACVAHELGFWELAREYYELTEQALADAGTWSETVRRQLRVVAINSVDLALDWASALAGIGEFDAAAARAAAMLTAEGDPTDDGWPPVWVEQVRASRHLLTALAGQPAAPAEERIAAFAGAVSAARAGDADRAARLAEAATDDVGIPLPTHAQLLRLGLIAKRPGTNATAVRYGDELARLRWNDRIDRMYGMRDAIAVERRRRDHEQLRRDLVVDELTGLANRRGYQAYLAAVDGASYAVMMIDADRFKAVNDTFGHDIGDVVLARLGDILSAHVRPADLAARLGGDEFVVILADVPADVAADRAQQILDAVRTHPWDQVAAGLAVSVSIGVHHGVGDELPTLLNDADRHLYHAKRHGRGRASSQVSTTN